MNRKRKKKIFSNKRLKSNPVYNELNWCLLNEPIVSIIEKKRVNKFIFKFGSYQVCDFKKR